jgi:dynein heavy chain
VQLKKIKFGTAGDVAKVVQGTLQAERQYFDTSKSMIRLWTHECMRVFADRFLKDSVDDIGKFIGVMSQVMRDHFEGAEWAEVMEDVDDERYGPIFCSFTSETMGTLPYEEVADYSHLKKCCEGKLEDYNLEPKLINMNLVLFKDAIRHICRIHRVEADALTAQRRHYMF